ncbi:hypothetical protein K9B32_20865 [Rhizobium sp. 3T7]|uniref:hypothetical protein n=1 Tax=Rhizobium sp. 3T7 TaxID=2874922 RepID=UPI001CCFC52F|nr:hypothetical protein [Rhizobium sp. 3T7]MBZ9792537.1 hypothetical protein [Rhizobium sp. 3T7]
MPMRLLIANPDLVRRPSLVSDFNAIDFGAIRRGARSMKYGLPMRMRSSWHSGSNSASGHIEGKTRHDESVYGMDV